MRLLELKNNGEFSLTKDLIDNIPPYAILSHTWGADDEEVTFKDLAEGAGHSKVRYGKIQFCGEQAARDKLQYFWVDTCCIDKSNSVELQEAITSMFYWYQNAAKCYVYLSDVSTTKRKASDQSSEFTWEPAFRSSRWFTRGWTLQELLAPASVEFFSRDGKRLGDKRTLERQIHDITGIAVPALQGTHLSEFSVDERLSWAETRQTKRSEDKAYSLLGIFNVHMPLIYGEGPESALSRLREEIHRRIRPAHYPTPLDCLPYAIEAPFNSYMKQHEPVCLPETRVNLLQEIYNWADGQDGRCIFWLNGLAGTGKSTIARTVARNYFDRKRLGASFFFSRGGGDVSNAGKFVTSIAGQLASSMPTLHQYICDAITERSDIASRSLRDQWHELVLRPLSKLDGNGCLSSYVLVVDALDECNDDDNIRIIPHLLAEARSLKRVRLRVFLTSRPEVPIRHGFYQIPDAERRNFVLHNILPSIVDHDITIFLEYNLNLIRSERSLDASWPGEEVITRLVQAASGLFIWAAIACRFIREGKRHAARRLDTILKGGGSAVTVTPPEKHLDEIYTTVLKHSIPSEYTDKEREESYRMLRQVLGSIVVLFATLSACSLSKLLHVPIEDINQTVEDMHSILNVPKDIARPLRLHHPSFRDFLLNNSRCQELDLWVDEKQAHRMLAEDCIRLMSTALKQDICGLGAPGKLVTNVNTSRVKQCFPLELQYACLYWIPHLQQSSPRLRDDDQVHSFLREHLLHWLEALGWMGKVSEGIHAIASLESLASSSESSRLSTFVHDAKRFGLYNRSAIEQAPLQIYCSALVFAPTSSIIRKQFKHNIPRWIRRLPEVESNWSALLQTLEGHSDSVNAVAFSPDGTVLSSASRDGAVKLWDARSGAALQTLKGHSGYVSAVAFSPDGKLLASASHLTVKLWDARSGMALKTLEDHSGYVSAVVFSPDGKLLASASDDMTVKLWDVPSGMALQTLEGHSDYVSAVAFTPDGKLLASASDRTVKLWDVRSGTALQTLDGHFNPVSGVAFSPDGRVLASALEDETVELWDAQSGAALQMLQGHSWFDAVAFSPDETVKLWDARSGRSLILEGHVIPVAFSPDGKLLASASDDRTVTLWDIRSRVALQMLEGHSGRVYAVAFSPDGTVLASASNDMTVRLWDVRSGTLLQTRKGHFDSVSAVAFSPDGTVLASVSQGRTVKLWDARSGEALQTLEGRPSRLSGVMFSLDSDYGYSRIVVFSPDSKLLASGSGNRTVKLWDVRSGVALQTLEDHYGYVNAVVFSPDGKLLASASGRTVKLWDVRSEMALQTLEGYFDSVSTVAFSPDGTMLASASQKETVKLWDVQSGAALQMLEGHSGHVIPVAFSPDGKLLASASLGTVKLWDVRSGATLQTLEGQSCYVSAVAFSPDGKMLVSASLDGKTLASGSGDSTVKLWDAGSGAVLQTLNVSAVVRTLSFSDDGISLHTDRGSLPISSFLPNDGVIPPQVTPSFFVEDQWVNRYTERILWLPPEYRPRCVAVCGSILGLGCNSGRVMIIEFAF